MFAFGLPSKFMISGLAVLIFSKLIIVSAGRRLNLESHSAKLAKHFEQPYGKDWKCTIVGPYPLSLTFPVRSCQRECMAGVVDDKIQLHEQAAQVFDVELKGNNCMCIAASETGKVPKVQFRALGLRDQCRTNAMDARKMCWHEYLKGLNTYFHTIVASNDELLSVPHHLKKYTDAMFHADPEVCAETLCEDKRCRVLSFPQLSDAIPRDVKSQLWKRIQEGDMDEPVQEYVDSLVPADLAALAFHGADTDGDGRLDKAELAAAFPSLDEQDVEEMMTMMGILRDREQKLNLEGFTPLFETVNKIHEMEARKEEEKDVRAHSEPSNTGDLDGDSANTSKASVKSADDVKGARSTGQDTSEYDKLLASALGGDSASPLEPRGKTREESDTSEYDKLLASVLGTASDSAEDTSDSGEATGDIAEATSASTTRTTSTKTTTTTTITTTMTTTTTIATTTTSTTTTTTTTTKNRCGHQDDPHVFHTITVGGFPDQIGGYDRSALNGEYVEAACEPINDRETYWKASVGSFLFYCEKERVWVLSVRAYLKGARTGQCLGFARGMIDRGVLDPDFMPFNRTYNGATGEWQNLTAAGVVRIATRAV